MAGEEEVELRDLVAQTLETKGVLGKIRVSLSHRRGFQESDVDAQCVMWRTG